MSKLKITVLKNNDEIENLTIEDFNSPFSIGRSQENDLVLDSPNVSRYHCVVVYEDQWKIEDLKSTNGYEINGHKELSSFLRSGDEVVLRPFLIKIIDIESDSNLLNEELKSDVDHDFGDATIVAQPANEEELDESEDATLHSASLIIENVFSLKIKSGLSAGATFQICSEIEIGRSSDSDVVIDDPAVSRRHLQLRVENGELKFSTVSSKNVTYLNGGLVKDGVLHHGDILRIGQTELEINKEHSKSTVQKGSEKTNRRKLVFAGAGLFVALVLITLLALRYGSSILGSGGAEGGGAENTAQEVQNNFNQQKEATLYKNQAQYYAKQGNYTKAISQLKMCLDLIPENQEVVSLLNSYRNILEKKEEDAFKRKQAVAEYEIEANKRLDEGKDFFIQNEFKQAVIQFSRLVSELKQYPELTGILSEAKKQLENSKVALDRQNDQKAQNEVSLRAKLSQVKMLYDEGQAAMKSEDYVAAKEKWEAAVAVDIESPERQKAVSELKELQKTLTEQVENDLMMAYELKRKGDLPNSLVYYQKVVAAAPNNKSVQNEFMQLLESQTAKAKMLYQKGLVYEGLNNLQEAKKYWKESLTELPLAASEYHIKAKNKLAEYH